MKFFFARVTKTVGPECIDGLIEINAKGIISIQSPGFMDKHLRKISIDSPVALLVCHGQRISGNRPAYTHVIEELVPARKGADPVITPIAVDTSAKLTFGYIVHELRENHPSFVHSSIHFVCKHKDGH